MLAVTLALTCLASVSYPGAAWRVAPSGTRQAFGKESQNRISQPGVAMSAVVDEVMEKLKSMSLLEASELVKAIEETFDVDASAAAGGGMPMMMAAPAAGGGDAGGEAAAPEQTEFDLILDGFADGKKITVLKEVRGITGLGLKEAKALVEEGGTVREAVPKADAEENAKKLEAAGAKVTIK